MARILVVDDDINNRLLLRLVLEHAGHEIMEASDGGEALASAHASKPDLIIMDLHMPRMGGIEFIKALRADAALANTRVALYTATLSDESMRQFMELAGIGCLIEKPSEPPELLAAVEAALRS
ncbi:MAG TPA: response regulator [Candidatus Eremiobacteraceae bacterium]